MGLSYTGLLVRWYDDLCRWTLAHCLRDTTWTIERARRSKSAGNKDIWYWLLELGRKPPTVEASASATAT